MFAMETKNTSQQQPPIRLTIQCNNQRTRNDSLSTCSSTPLSPLSMTSSSFFSTSSCASSSLTPMSSSPPLSPVTPKTPIPIDSPLFNKPPLDTRRKRYKSFSKEVRRGRSFRTSRERSVDQADSKLSSPAPQREVKSGDQVTFLIKKNRYGKDGWKLMPEDENFNLKQNGHILAQAVEALRHMLYAGHDIPTKLSLVIQ